MDHPEKNLDGPCTTFQGIPPHSLSSGEQKNPLPSTKYSQLLEPTTLVGKQKINLPSFLLALAANQNPKFSRDFDGRGMSLTFNPRSISHQNTSPSAFQARVPFSPSKGNLLRGDLLLLQIASFTKGDLLRISPPLCGGAIYKGEKRLWKVILLVMFRRRDSTTRKNNEMFLINTNILSICLPPSSFLHDFC